MRIVLRFRSRTSRTGRFVTGSLAVHAVLVAVLLALPGFAKRPALVEDALFVELAGGLPAPRGGPAPAVAPEPPAPAPPPEGPSVVEEVPPPAKRPPEPKTEKKPEKKPEPPPSPAPPGPPGDAPPTSPGGAGASAFPDATGTGITALGSGDPTLAGYYARISALLNAQWIRPVLLDEGGGPRSTVVSFEIARNGTVFNLRIDEASGLDVLDRSALRAVLDASPLPPPPGGWRGNTVPVRVRFVLDPDTP